MRHLPLVAQHGVLVRPEQGEDLVHEVVQTPLGTHPRGRPGAVRRSAPHTGDVAIDVPEHLLVESVEFVRRGHRPGATVLRGRLTVLGIEVPAATDRLVALHEISEPSALPAVEVLHTEGLAGVRPRREGLGRAEELLVRRDHDTLGAKHPFAVEGHRCHGDDVGGCTVATMGVQTSGERRRVPMVHLEALVPQLLHEATQRCQHEVEPLTVPALRRQLRGALHHEHPYLTGSPLPQGAHDTGQLVPEHPDRVHDRTLRPRSHRPAGREPISPRSPPRSR